MDQPTSIDIFLNYGYRVSQVQLPLVEAHHRLISRSANTEFFIGQCYDVVLNIG
jgi:hypothetical protein